MHFLQLLSSQNEGHKNCHTGHGGNLEQDSAVDPKEKKFKQHQAGVQIFIQSARANLSNMQKPQPDSTGSHEKNYPWLPRHDNCNQNHDGAEYGSYTGKKQISASLLLFPHAFSNSFVTRLSSS